MTRRSYLKYAAGVVAVGVVAVAGYGAYEATQPSTPTSTATPTFTSTTAAPASTATGKPTLHVIGFGFPPVLALKNFIPDFEKDQNCNVVYEAGMGWDEECSKVMLDVGSSSPGKVEYDVWCLSSDFRIPFPHTLPLDEYMKTTTNPERLAIDDYVPVSIKAGRFKGHQVWFGASTTWNIVYRTDLFKANGIEVPTTTDQLLEAAKKVGYVVGQAFADPQTFSTFNWLKAFGGQWVDPMTFEPQANTPQAADFMAWWKEMYATMDPAVSGWGWDDAISHFNSGKSGMVQILTEYGNICQDPTLDPNYYDKVDYMMMPSGPAGKGNVCGGLGWAVNQYSPVPELAYKFIEWAMSPQQLRKTMEFDPTASLNARPSILTDPDMVKKFKWFPLQADNLNWSWYNPNVTNWFQVIETIAGRMEEILLKNADIKTTLDALQSDLLALDLPRFGIAGYEV